MKKKLFAAVLMLVISVVALTTATLAWFEGSDTVTIKTITANIKATAGLLIAPGASATTLDDADRKVAVADWTTTIDYTTGIGGLGYITGTTLLQDLTTSKYDAGGNHVIGTMLGTSGTGATEFYGQKETAGAVANRDYLRLEFWLRTESATELELKLQSTDSSTKTNANVNFRNGATAQGFEGTQADRGGYVTYIALYQMDSDENGAAASEVENVKVTTPVRLGLWQADAVAPTIGTEDATRAAKGSLYETGAYVRPTVEIDTVGNATTALNGFKLEAGGKAQHYVVYIWIEGTDAYCTSIVAGGKLTFNLVIGAIEPTP